MDKKQSNPVGRPTDYNIDLASEICEQIIEGKSLASICRSDGMPNAATVYRWIARFPEFREMYEKAKEDQADILVEQILDIADNAANDYMEGVDDAGYRLNGENIQRSRLRVDSRKWCAAKLKARKYGDKTINETNLNVSGGLDLSSKSDDELKRMLSELDAKITTTVNQ